MCPVCYQTGGSLLHCPSTLTIASGIFLLHCPWSHLHRPLTGILPYEARTFLTCGLSTLAAAIICPTYLLYAITHFRHPNTFFLENQVVTIYLIPLKFSSHHSQRHLRCFHAASQLTLLINRRSAHSQHHVLIHASMIQP